MCLVFNGDQYVNSKSSLGRCMKKINAAEFLIQKTKDMNVQDEAFLQELASKHSIKFHI